MRTRLTAAPTILLLLATFVRGHATRSSVHGARTATEAARMRSQRRQLTGAVSSNHGGHRTLQRTVQEFCANLTDLEAFLTTGFMEIFDSPDDEPPTLFPESGYQCACAIPGTDPSLTCKLNYTWPDANLTAGETQDYYINTEQANFTTTAQNGVVYYVPTVMGWCDGIDGLPESDHCETYEFCDHDDDVTTAVQVCSCSTNQGDGCPTCDICEDGITVAINCTSVEEGSPFNYFTTCEDDNYAGPLLSGYRDKVTDIVSVAVQEKSATKAEAASASPAAAVAGRDTSSTFLVRSAITNGCVFAFLLLAFVI